MMKKCAAVLTALTLILGSAVPSLGAQGPAASAGNAASAAETVYAGMDHIVFGFMSGVGAWETMLKVAPDGSFQGVFYDMNMGETGEGYENGTLYECFFTGRFSAAEQISETAYAASVAELNYEKEINGSDRYIDEEHMLHIMSDPYGLRQGDEVMICLPGYPVSQIEEEIMSWLTFRMPTDASQLPEITILNTTEHLAFYPDSYADFDYDEISGAAESAAQETAAIVAQESVAEALVSAYASQRMPDVNACPAVPALYTWPAPRSPWNSVTPAALQGRWVNRYTDTDGSSMLEILTVNGLDAKIESYQNGVRTSVWNGEGTLTLEDRSARNISPKIAVVTQDGSGAGIVVRWVKEDAFYDGLFLTEWKREMPENPADQFLFDTVTAEALQGVWYSEYYEGESVYQDVLTISGTEGSIFETKDGVPMEGTWNGAGAFDIQVVEFRYGQYYPELILSMESGPAAGGSIGIYISSVEADRFYDAGFNRWFVRIR